MKLPLSLDEEAGDQFAGHKLNKQVKEHGDVVTFSGIEQPT